MLLTAGLFPSAWSHLFANSLAVILCICYIKKKRRKNSANFSLNFSQGNDSQYSLLWAQGGGREKHQTCSLAVNRTQRRSGDISSFITTVWMSVFVTGWLLCPYMSAKTAGKLCLSICQRNLQSFVFSHWQSEWEKAKLVSCVCVRLYLCWTIVTLKFYLSLCV